MGDSHAGPADVGTVDEPLCLLAGLAEQAAVGRLLGRRLGGDDLIGVLEGRFSLAGPSRNLDDYVEAQVHGGVDLGVDVEALVLDPSFRGSDVQDDLSRAADRYGFELRWHGGSQLAASEVPAAFRGPTMPALGRRVARVDGVIDAHSIGRAAAQIDPGPRLSGGDPPDSDLQQLKYLWHTPLAFGRDP